MTDEEKLDGEAGPLDGEEYWINLQYALSSNKKFWARWLKERIQPYHKSGIYPKPETKAAKDLSAALRGISVMSAKEWEEL